jgi:extradiol dioxygenase family protein
MISDKFQPSLSSGMLIHVAIPSYELDKSLNFYRDVIGATPFRILDDRVTFGFHNLQLVCHLTNRNDNQPNSGFYPRHFGITFIEHTEYQQFYESVLAQYGSFVYSSLSSRFSGRSDEHMTFILQDPSSNFVEFKHYLSPDSSF